MPRAVRPVAVFVVLVVFMAVAQRAWVTEDAYITFRTVDNFVSGHGLRWNPDERVQAFTHPLWMFLHIPPYAVTGEIFFTSIFLGLGCTIGAVVTTLRRSTSVWSPLVLGLPLVMSQSFCDFGTSGLENPLTFLLLALFFGELIGPARPGRLALFAGLAATNRIDTLVFFLPALLLVGVRERARAIPSYLLGFLPFLLWELFSLFYYGFLFPNTAYAKLSTGLSRSAYLSQGVAYAADLVTSDPASALILLLGGVAVVLRLLDLRQEPRDQAVRHELAFAVGWLGYLAYVIWVGGDFMSGRFWSAPVFGASMLLFTLAERRGASLEPGSMPALGGVMVVALCVWPRATFFGDTNTLTDAGIVDERAFWAESNALESWRRGSAPAASQLGKRGGKLREKAEKNPDVREVSAATLVGMVGFYAGPGVILVDRMALSEPVLARLPVIELVDWRIGHFERAIPAGYLDARRTDDPSRIKDPDLAAWYTHLRTITAGPLFDGHRISEIIAFNLGSYDHLLAPYVERLRSGAAEIEETDAEIKAKSRAAKAGEAKAGDNKSSEPKPGEASPGVSDELDLPGGETRGSPSGTVALSTLSRPMADHTRWDAPGAAVFPASGVLNILADPAVSGETIELSVDAKDPYTLRFFAGDTELGQVELPRVAGRHPGLAVRELALPEGAKDQPISRIEITAKGDGKSSVGHLIVR